MLLLPACLHAQELSYTRFDIQHGLANSTVYCMLQDKQGFLWFGTETGVSRFDGTHFKNFTTIQGLSDNQILEMFEDSKGRIWMAPFNESICYYYKGKIYNQQNDSTLASIKPEGHILSFAEDRQGNILVLQFRRFYIISPDNHVTLYMADEKSVNTLYMGADTTLDGKFQVMDVNKLLKVKKDGLEFVRQVNAPFRTFRFVGMRRGIVIWREQHTDFTMLTQKGVTQLAEGIAPNVIKINILNDSLVALNTQTGCLIYNINSSNQVRTFLPNEPISTTFQDREGNLWFCTLGHGIYMLNSAYISNISLIDPSGSRMGAYSIIKFNNGWLVGSDMVTLYHIPEDRSTARMKYRYLEGLPERIMSLQMHRDGNLLMGTDSRLDRLNANLKRLGGYHGMVVKTATMMGGDSLLIASGRDAFWFDVKTFKPFDTIWNERATTAYYRNDTAYIGTLDGLFLVVKGTTSGDAGKEYPQFRGRIMDIRESPADGTLWVATYSGVYAYKGGKVLSGLTEQQGLVSNICRTLYIYGNELWVGTNKGLQRIDITDPMRPVPGYVLSNELSSNIINTVLADSTMVAVGTPEGVSIFDKTMVSFNAKTDLYIDNIIVSGTKLDWTGEPFFLSNRDNNIRFEFAGISYRSAGDIRYEFRLLGLDSNWRTTRDNFLNYPTLPGGSYRLQIQAVNKFGNKSGMLSVPFSIEKELWQKPWFQVLVAVISGLLIWFLLSWRIRVIRNQESEKNNIRKKIASLEQLALKSQMNPHFIFNSLNSIQHYVLDKDIEGANRFITGFSRLIRQTLDISTRHEITLAEEVSYLSTYLQLEKIRLENKFSFEVTTDPSLNPEASFLPPMILQPFVENCVRHGIRYRHDNQGKITIAFKRSGNLLDCVIEDNGVGRKIALSHKSNNPIEYQSKGISLTTDRVEMMNKHSARPITIHIYDMEDGSGNGTGTRVIISFPLQQTDYLEL